MGGGSVCRAPKARIKKCGGTRSSLFFEKTSLLADGEFIEERTFNRCVGVKLYNLSDK